MLTQAMSRTRKTAPHRMAKAGMRNVTEMARAGPTAAMSRK